jgi:SAM-dependent methyltransferase
MRPAVIDMNVIEKATVIHYLRHRVREFRPGTAEALGWRSAESQWKRFELLLRLGDFQGRSLLDAGCGYGDFKGFLDRHCQDFTYVGIDQMPEFIREAKARYGGQPDTHFFQADFTQAELPQMDYVVASGVFCYRSAEPGHSFQLIRKLFQAAKTGLAFNMLDAAIFPWHDLLIGHDRGEITAFCRSLAPRVECIGGYLEDDFTIFMYHDVAS